jgi:hypothetical protein
MAQGCWPFQANPQTLNALLKRQRRRRIDFARRPIPLAQLATVACRDRVTLSRAQSRMEYAKIVGVVRAGALRRASCGNMRRHRSGLGSAA